MQSAIDFGKNFLTQFFNKRDPEASRAFLADDVIWITPNDIRHLKTSKSIRDFLAASIREDSNAYNVDIASIRSAPVLETTSIVVYDINLIPKHEESAVNLRCTMAFHKQGVGFAIVYVGMSRKYQRTDVEQIRSFADALPGGIMVLAAKQNQIQLLYASAWFFHRLGYEEAVFYDEMEKNSFFMMPFVEQKRMNALIGEMAALKKPKPLAMRVSLLKKGGTSKIACHMSVAAAYKDGSQTVLYLIFDEITDVMTEIRREHKKETEEIRKKAEQTARDQLDAEIAAAGGTNPDDVRRTYEKKLASVRAEARAAVEESARLAQQEADAAERLIKVKLEQAIREKDAAVETARKQITEQLAGALKEEKDRNAGREAELQEQMENAQKAASDAGQETKSLKERLAKLEVESRAADQQYQERILKLERELMHAREDARKKVEEARDEMTKEMEASARKAEEEKEKAVADIQEKLDRTAAKAQKENAELQHTVSQQQADLERQELSLKQKETERKALNKEKDKSIRRMGSLLRGQMQSIRSIAGTAKDTEDTAKLREEMTRIEEMAKEMPQYADDLTAISLLDPNGRKTKSSDFSIQSCLDLVRRVIWPECRAKGLIFSIGVNSDMPDAVTGSKAGLELAFLSILENAVQNTAGGGRITMSARSDPSVRGSAYYHFTIADTGQGIPEDKLPVLFDRPESELAIARKAVGSMGGAIQVRSQVGEGTTFEILVNLKLQAT